MHFDALCMACVRDELEANLLPGRVQQIVLAGPRTLGLELYANQRRHALLIQADGQDPRVHLVAARIRRGAETDTPLLLLLRKYARDAMLTAVRQPIAYERVLELAFEQREHGTTRLWVELTGRSANLVLVDVNERILDCLVRVPDSPTAFRALLPGRTYRPPPELGRLPPVDDGSAEYYERLTQIVRQPGPLWRSLSVGLAGVSPTQGREVAWRAAGDAAASGEGVEVVSVAAALQELWLPLRTGEWHPSVWRVDGQVQGFAPNEVHFAGGYEPAVSLSAALESWAARAASPLAGERDGYAELRRSVASELQRARKRVAHQLEALEVDEPPPGAAQALRVQAEWLLALHHSVVRGQESLMVPAEYTGGEPLRIDLDPTRTPVEQAEVFFRRAGKYERAARFIPERRARLHADLEYLAQLEVDLAQAADQPEIVAVRADLHASRLLPLRGRIEKPKPKERAGVRKGPRVFRTADGSRILVGRFARENERLTFEIARPDDLWLHARGVAGSHVVVQGADGREPGAAAAHAAAMLAAWFSAARGEAAVDVIVSRRRHVSRAPGGHPGQVIVRREEVIRVPARMPEGVEGER